MADRTTLPGAVGELMAKKYGGVLAEFVANPTLGTTVAEVLGSDPEHVLVIIINLSANTVYLNFRPDPSATNGIRLEANGGAMILEADDDGPLVTRTIYGVATGVASQLFITRVRREALLAKGEV